MPEKCILCGCDGEHFSNGWTPIRSEDDLPEDAVTTLVQWANGEIQIYSWKWRDDPYEGWEPPIAWHPLPAPYHPPTEAEGDDMTEDEINEKLVPCTICGWTVGHEKTCLKVFDFTPAPAEVDYRNQGIATLTCTKCQAYATTNCTIEGCPYAAPAVDEVKCQECGITLDESTALWVDDGTFAVCRKCNDQVEANWAEDKKMLKEMGYDPDHQCLITDPSQPVVGRGAIYALAEKIKHYGDKVEISVTATSGNLIDIISTADLKALADALNAPLQFVEAIPAMKEAYRQGQADANAPDKQNAEVDRLREGLLMCYSSYGVASVECYLTPEMIEREKERRKQFPEALSKIEAMEKRIAELTATQNTDAASVRELVEAATVMKDAISTLPNNQFGIGGSDENTHWFIRDELIGRAQAALAKFEVEADKK